MWLHLSKFCHVCTAEDFIISDAVLNALNRPQPNMYTGQEVNMYTGQEVNMHTGQEVNIGIGLNGYLIA